VSLSYSGIVPTDIDPSEDTIFTIEQLATASGVNVRTIRYYIAEGLLHGPGARGKNAVYTEQHLLRLKLVRLLVEQRVPLSEIRERLAALSPGDIRSLLSEETQRQTSLRRAAEAPSPKSYINRLLERSRVYPSHPAEPAVSACSPAPSLLPSASPPVPSMLRSVPLALPAVTPNAGSPDTARKRASPEAARETADELADETTEDRWRRIALVPGLELHVKANVEPHYVSLIETLRAIASAHEC
jgi:DNA-binding transcriptional MerR regulator